MGLFSSARSRIKRVGRKVKGHVKRRVRRHRKLAKRIGRKTAPIKAKIAPYVTAAAAGVATVFVGPVGGAAVTAAGAGMSRYYGATAARSKGIRGREARKAGRKLMRKSMIGGLAGTTLGVGTSLVAGGSALTGVYGGSILGLGGSASTAASSVATAPGTTAASGGSSILSTVGTGTSVLSSAGQVAGMAGGASQEDIDYGEMDPRTGMPASMTPTYGSQEYQERIAPLDALQDVSQTSPGSSWLDTGLDIAKKGAGIYLGGSADPGTVGSGKPGMPTDSDTYAAPPDEENPDGGGFLSNPLMVAGLAVAGAFLIHKL